MSKLFTHPEVSLDTLSPDAAKALLMDAQFERESQGALRGLRDAEGALRLNASVDREVVSSVTVGRQWLEGVIDDRKKVQAVCDNLIDRGAELSKENARLRDQVERLESLAAEMQSELIELRKHED